LVTGYRDPKEPLALPKPYRLREKANALKHKADALLREADALLAEADRIEGNSSLQKSKAESAARK
jgi:hypothetical protein